MDSASGFLENGETVQQGAARETLEEAEARVEVGNLFSLFNLPHINQVYMLFRGRMLTADCGAGAESLETLLLEESQIPWEQIAFPVILQSLMLYYQDRAKGEFQFHSGDILRLPESDGRIQIRMHEPG